MGCQCQIVETRRGRHVTSIERKESNDQPTDARFPSRRLFLPTRATRSHLIPWLATNPSMPVAIRPSSLLANPATTD